MKEVLAVRHVAFEHLGSLEPVLRGRGYAVRYLEAGVDNLSAVEADAADLVVLLGGPISAYEDDMYPFLQDELRLIESRLKHNLPFLGICLGAQMLARGLGAKVFRGPHTEIGWAPIALTEAGQQSCLSHLEMAQWHVLHWHGDTFDLPQGAVHLASSSMVPNQAFQFNKALGLQFHVEVRGEEIECWLIGHACEIAATPHISVQHLRADTQQWGPKLQPAAQACFATWLDEVGL